MHKPDNQQGAVLVISLIMLLLLTLIGVAGMQATTLEENMAGNMRDSNQAFQAAESALKAGETAAATIAPTIICPSAANPIGYYLPYDVDCNGVPETTPVWENATIWSDNTKSIPYTGSLSNVSASPHFIIEDLGAQCASATLPCPAADQRHNYRVTARATGATTNAAVMLQSIFQVEAP